MKEQIINLETKLAFAEKSIEDLSGELYKNTIKVDQLEAALTELQARLSGLEDHLGDHLRPRLPEDDIPPHY